MGAAPPPVGFLIANGCYVVLIGPLQADERSRLDKSVIISHQIGAVERAEEEL